jgi:hypothetical protein
MHERWLQFPPVGTTKQNKTTGQSGFWMLTVPEIPILEKLEYWAFLFPIIKWL